MAGNNVKLRSRGVRSKESHYYCRVPRSRPQYGVFRIDALKFLQKLPRKPLFDLVVTSPPYNIGKSYEQRKDLDEYIEWQRSIISQIVARLRPSGSICWQVGNFVDNGRIEPLDILLHPIFSQLGLQLRNRIIWCFGHGLHCQRRFSGRYEVVLWYTKSDDYYFDLDPVRVNSKYPGKRFYKGPNAGRLSSHPNGKNPEDVWKFGEDVWSIPNVKGNHKEKTIHPCQFPVGLAERLVLSLSKRRARVYDPFCGVGSSGVAAAVHGRSFWGTELVEEYGRIACERIDAALKGVAVYRSHDQPIYDHTKSRLSVRPAI